MAGEPIKALWQLFEDVIAVLRKDPYALETAYVSLITYSSVVEMSPLCELPSFKLPNLPNITSGPKNCGLALKKVLDKLDQFKFPLLILALGVFLMLIPSSPKGENTAPTTELGEALSLTQGVGEAYVLISENGVVVVCEGAQNAEVRMKIMEAVRSYTGFGADKITILKRSGSN